eukprot:6185965-Pleurochrysis_carterae.AAC.3
MVQADKQNGAWPNTASEHDAKASDAAGELASGHMSMAIWLHPKSVWHVGTLRGKGAVSGDDGVSRRDSGRSSRAGVALWSV